MRVQPLYDLLRSYNRFQHALCIKRRTVLYYARVRPGPRVLELEAHRLFTPVQLCSLFLCILVILAVAPTPFNIIVMNHKRKTCLSIKLEQTHL